MSKFKIGDKVKVVMSTKKHKNKHLGDIFTIREINPNGKMRADYGETHYGVVEEDKCVFIWLESELELVEDKKVFTKKDLKTGMFGYFDNERDDWFVIVGDRFMYESGSGDFVHFINDNLVMPSGRKITALYTGICFLHAKMPSNTPIWKREKEKPLYNGKVVCIAVNNNIGEYTKGKIYQFKEGILTNDNGEKMREGNPATSFKDWRRWSSAEWLEVVE